MGPSAIEAITPTQVRGSTERMNARHIIVVLCAMCQLCAGQNVPLDFTPQTTPKPGLKAATPSAPWQDNLFMILLNFPDLASTFTRDQFVTQVGVMCSFYQNSSYGMVTITPTITPQFYVLPQPSTFYTDRHLLAQDALAVVANDWGDVLNIYNHVVFAFPRRPLGFDGYSEPQLIWLNGTVSGWMLSHEMGHQYGLWHAHLWAP